MKQYRLDKSGLWEVLAVWDVYLPRPVRVVACGGTALTLQDLKASTKDVDLLIPDEEEHRTLIATLTRLGYRRGTAHGWRRDDGFIFDLFRGKTVFQTELLESPLDEGNYIPISVLSKLAVSALNDLDLVISKMSRGDDVDVEDCVALIKSRGGGFDLERLKARCRETASYAIDGRRMLRNLGFLLAALAEEG